MGVWKWHATERTGGVAVYATLGGADVPVAGHGARHRYEYFVGLAPERDDVAAALALLPGFAGREGLGDGHTVEVEGGLWPGSPMNCWLLAQPQSGAFVPDAFVFGALQVQWLQAVPLHPQERSWKAVHGADALWAAWESAGVPVWDANRRPWSGSR